MTPFKRSAHASQMTATNRMAAAILDDVNQVALAESVNKRRCTNANSSTSSSNAVGIISSGNTGAISLSLTRSNDRPINSSNSCHINNTTVSTNINNINRNIKIASSATTATTTTVVPPTTNTDIKNLDWKKLTEVLWNIMLPHVARMAESTANAEDYNLENPLPAGTATVRAFLMPWKEIWQEFIQVTGTNVGRRNIQARGRTLISKRYKCEKRHRWKPEEDAELLKAIAGVEQVYVEQGEASLADMNDREKKSFWSMVYCTIKNVKRTNKSMRGRHFILEQRRMELKGGDAMSNSLTSQDTGVVATPLPSERKSGLTRTGWTGVLNSAAATSVVAAPGVAAAAAHRKRSTGVHGVAIARGIAPGVVNGSSAAAVTSTCQPTTSTESSRIAATGTTAGDTRKRSTGRTASANCVATCAGVSADARRKRSTGSASDTARKRLAIGAVTDRGVATDAGALAAAAWRKANHYNIVKERGAHTPTAKPESGGNISTTSCETVGHASLLLGIHKCKAALDAVADTRLETTMNFHPGILDNMRFELD